MIGKETDYIYRRYILVILSGIIFGFFFPPVESSYIILFSLVPFLMAISTATSSKNAFFMGFAFGVSTFILAGWWIFYNKGADGAILKGISGIGMMCFVSTYFGVLGLFISYLKRYVSGRYWLYLVPFVWVFIEHIMMYEELAFPWFVAYMTVSNKLEFIQIADMFGSEFISFLVILFNILFYRLIEEVFFYRRKLRLIAVPIIIVVLFFALKYYGMTKITDFMDSSQTNDKYLTEKVAIVNPSFGVKYKWKKKNLPEILFRQMTLTDSIMAKDSPDLIVWGESNYPAYLETRPAQILKFRNWAKTNTPLLIGSLGFDGYNEEQKRYNSIFYFSKDGQGKRGDYTRYDKAKLVPFGEFFPYSDTFPFLKGISLGHSNYDRGSHFTVFPTENSRVSGYVCYESIFSYYIAGLADSGAEYFVNISNDGWYEATSQINQHTQFNIFRAIENRRSVVRLANKGENIYIDPVGRVQKLFDETDNTAKTVSIKTNKDKTFFTNNHITIRVTFTLIGIGLILIIAYKKLKNKLGF